MAYAPPPAEEYLESDDDDFGIIASAAADNASQSYATSHGAASGGFNWGSGSDTSRNNAKKKSPPRSKIPVVSPTQSGVNLEDFRLALIRGSVETVAKYIKEGVDVNVTFKTGWTPLMYASHQINQSLMSILLTHGATPDQGKTTALMSCCTTNVLNKEDEVEQCVNSLVSHGADVNSVDKYSMTPLMMACKKGHIGAVRALLASGADVNKRETRGFSALCWACTSGNLPCIKALVSFGADISVETLEGQTPVRLAATSANYTQISAYFSTLPGFQRHTSEEEAGWVPPSDNLTNGNSSVKDSPVNVEPQAKTDTTTSEHLDKTVYGKFGELEVFLYGLEMSSLVPKFQSHDITLEHLLNITDDELIKSVMRSEELHPLQVGVQSVGQRRKILDSVHELHKKDWQPSSIPAYEKVRNGKQLSCAEVTAIIANSATHSACLSASMKYVRSQVAVNAGLLQVDKHGRGVHILRRFLHEMIENCEKQQQAAVALRTEIEKSLHSGQAETVDHITRETTAKSANKLVVYSSALLTLGVVSLGIYLLSKKFPHVRLGR